MKGINQKDGPMLKRGTDFSENQPCFLEKRSIFKKRGLFRRKGVIFLGWKAPPSPPDGPTLGKVWLEEY